MRNSFPDEFVCRSVYQKYYQMLQHGKFPMKEKKIPLVGPPNCGQTSWFAPFQGEYYIYFNTCEVMLYRKDLLHRGWNKFLFDRLFLLLTWSNCSSPIATKGFAGAVRSCFVHLSLEAFPISAIRKCLICRKSTFSHLFY